MESREIRVIMALFLTYQRMVISEIIERISILTFLKLLCIIYIFFLQSPPPFDNAECIRSKTNQQSLIHCLFCMQLTNFALNFVGKQSLKSAEAQLSLS